MRYWAQFYNLRHREDGSVYWDEATGSDQVFILDGRLGLASRMTVAREECIKRGFQGYRIMRGQRLSDGEIVSSQDGGFATSAQVIPVDDVAKAYIVLHNEAAKAKNAREDAKKT